LCPLSDKHAFVEHRKLDTKKDIQGKDIVAGQDEGKKKKSNPNINVELFLRV